MNLIALITTVAGLIAFVLKWWLDPQRIDGHALSNVKKQISSWQRKRDEAMLKGNVDALTRSVQMLKELMLQQKILEEKLKQK